MVYYYGDLILGFEIQIVEILGLRKLGNPEQW